MMMVDQLGECLRVGLIPDVQGCEPVELAGSCARTGLGHLGDSEIDAVGKNSREQQDVDPSPVRRSSDE